MMAGAHATIASKKAFRRSGPPELVEGSRCPTDSRASLFRYANFNEGIYLQANNSNG